MPPALMPLPTAAGPHQRADARAAAVLAPQLAARLGGPGAEVAAVDDQALLAALHLEHEAADGDVWDRFEAGADAALVGIDAPG